MLIRLWILVSPAELLLCEEKGSGFGFWCPLPSSWFCASFFVFCGYTERRQSVAGVGVGTERLVLAPRREERQG